MTIICYGCGRGMGENDAKPSEETMVWYGMHDSQGCGAGMSPLDVSIFSRHVEAQNALPRLSTAHHKLATLAFASH